MDKIYLLKNANPATAQGESTYIPEGDYAVTLERVVDSNIIVRKMDGSDIQYLLGQPITGPADVIALFDTRGTEASISVVATHIE